MFESIAPAPADPILGLADLYRADTRTDKINLGIGIYKTEQGDTPVLNCVKKAEKRLLDIENTKNYLSIDGYESFAKCTQEILLGGDNPMLQTGRVRTAQAPGGTGALRVISDFLARQTRVKRVWISNPTWPNHRNIFEAAGLEVLEYRYYEQENNALDIDGLVTSLSAAQNGDVVVFHGCCHNPSGIDPTPEQWQQLALLSKRSGWLPIFDFAYQGFGKGLDEDAFGLRAFAEMHNEMFIASSYSKNFGLYNERVGAVTLIAGDAQIAENAFSQIKFSIRANYSNPPSHGAAVVATILNDSELRAMWQQELAEMRQRIQRMRMLFVNTLKEKGAQQDFDFITQQNGMFSFSGLTAQQVLRLREEFGIYAVASGRVNVAGMTPTNMSELCEAVVAVL